MSGVRAPDGVPPENPAAVRLAGFCYFCRSVKKWCLTEF
nr:MAG TPA: hypothetical protein [Caudoviricetes sp.]